MDAMLEAMGRVDARLVACTHAIFEQYGIALHEPPDLTSAEPVPPGESFAGTLGYVGENVRGALTIMTTADVLSQSLAPELRRADAMRDFAGELVNMLLGRLKNQLVRAGASFEVATPVTAHGYELRLAMAPGAIARSHLFDSSFGPIHVRLDAVFGPGFSLLADDEQALAANDDNVVEGEMLLF